MTTVPLVLAEGGPGQNETEWCWERIRSCGCIGTGRLSILRRYFRLSMETGGLPSMLEREFFRSRVTSYHIYTFEDVVIFVHDVERCLERLDGFSRDLIARIALQEYTQEECARLLGCTRRTIARGYQEALDHLSEIFLSVGII